MHLRTVVAAVTFAAGALAPATLAQAAGAPIMPLSEVQPGMMCTGASVVRGTTIDTFNVHIDDVLRARDIGDARLLFTVSGPAVDATGIGPGFSGSPITCTGADGVARVAGAISESIGEYGGKRALARPIEAILAEPADPTHGAKVARAAQPVVPGARPIAEPLTLSGLDPELGRVFEAAARRAHRTLFAAPAAPPVFGQAAQVLTTPLVPGGAVAVDYSTGDVSAAAIGTVVYVDGDRAWLFGHQLDGAGRRSLTLSTAYVYTVISNPLSLADSETYKLAAPMSDIGTLVQDGVNGVVGRVGPLPRRYPFRVITIDSDRNARRDLTSQIADERGVGSPGLDSTLATVAAGEVAQGAYATMQGLPANLSGRVCVRVTVRQRPKPMSFCNTYVGVGGGPAAFANGAIVQDVGAAALLLESYTAGPLDITDARVGMRLSRSLRLGTIMSAKGPLVVRRGTSAKVVLTLRGSGGARFTRTITVPIPRTMPAGPRDLLLSGHGEDGPGDLSGGASLADLLGGGSSEPAAPATVKELAQQFAAFHREDGLGARFLHIGGRPRADLPGGAEGVAQRRRFVFRSDTLRIAGTKRVAVLVR